MNPGRNTGPGAIITVPSRTSSVLASVASAGYGDPLPTVFGTARVTGKYAYFDAAMRRQTGDSTKLWGKQGDGSWTANVAGWYGPAEIVFCQGPIASFGYVWREGDIVPQPILQNLSVNPYPDNGANDAVLFGTGTETAWVGLTGQTTPIPYQLWVQIKDLVYDPVTTGYTWTAQGASSEMADNGVNSGNATLDLSFKPFDFARVDSAEAAATSSQWVYYYNGSGVWYFPNRIHLLAANSSIRVCYTYNPQLLPTYSAATPMRGVAQFRLASLGIISSESLSKIEAEIAGFSISSSSPSGQDADFADVIEYLLQRAGVPAENIETTLGPDGTAASGFRRYCRAMGFYGTKATTSVQTVADHIAEIETCTHSRHVWVGGRFKMIPLGDTEVTGNGVTYTPAAPVTALGPDDYKPQGDGEDPVTSTRVAPEDVYTVWPVSFPTRWASGNPTRQVAGTAAPDRYPVYQSMTLEVGVSDALSTPVRRAQTTDLPWVTNAQHAAKISQLLGLRSVNIKTTFQFRLGPRWAALEPGDIVTLAEPKLLGAQTVNARITKIDKDEDGYFAIDCEEWPAGTGTAKSLVTQIADGMAAAQVGINTSGGTGSSTNYGVQAYNAIIDASADNKLTPAEKTGVVQQYAALWAQKAVLDAQAAAFASYELALMDTQLDLQLAALADELAVYDAALDALQGYMVSLGLADLTDASIAAWQTTTTTIDGPTFRSVFAAAQSQTAVMLQALQTTAKSAADASNAAAHAANESAGAALTLAGSKSKVFYRASAPTNPDDNLTAGDIWFDTSVFTDTDGRTKTHNKPYTWSGTAWVAVPNADKMVVSELAVGCVAADQIAANAVIAGKIAANAVTADKLDATTINASGKLTVGAITGLGALATKSTVGNSDITTIDGGKITTGTIDAARISTLSLATIALTVGGVRFDTSWFAQTNIHLAFFQITNGVLSFVRTFNVADVGAGSYLDSIHIYISFNSPYTYTYGVASIQGCQDQGWNVKPSLNSGGAYLTFYAGNSSAQTLTNSNVNLSGYFIGVSSASNTGGYGLV